MELRKINTGFISIAGGVITFLVTAFMFLISASEYINVGLLKKTSGYPFGGEGPAPWYYYSSETYSNYNLVVSIIYLLLLLTTIVLMRKNNKIGLYLIFGTAVLLTFIQVAML